KMGGIALVKRFLGIAVFGLLLLSGRPLVVYGPNSATLDKDIAYRPRTPFFADTDGDGLTDDIDEDDDNDGIPDLYENGCETSTPFGTPPSSLLTSNYVTSIYTDYKGFWSSSTSSINPTAYDNVSTLLAFQVGSKTYATGVTSSRMIDNNSNGYFEQMDTDGNGTGDVNVEETSWVA